MAVASPMPLSAHALTLQRGHRVLVKGFDLSLKPGDGVCLRGANGSGKTTLLRAFAGLHEVKFGEINGNDTDDGPCQISFLGHQDPIKAGQSVRTQLVFWATLAGRDTQVISDIAKELGILGQLDLQGGVISAGQRRRLSLARLLIEGRPIWLLDEPAAPLDSAGRDLLGHLLDRHRAQGGLFVAAVHDDLPGQPTRTIWLDRP
jgi:heme exporter protein A